MSTEHRHEENRLTCLDQYGVLDTPPEEAFDRVTRLTRRVFQVPISTVTLIDGHRQWFKSRQGLDVPETPRGPALCNLAIQEARPLVIPDALADKRFSQNPFVVEAPHIRFYAGAPLLAPEGYTVGTLCVVDTKPRTLDPEQVDTLLDLARIVVTELELRRLATTDGLTGALSRRAFRDEAGRAVALALRHRHDLSCILFDLDHFKGINDAHGHATGDRVLTETAATGRGSLRTSDLLGRIGGEEFAIVLPHTGRTAAVKVAEKIRATLARQRVEGPSGPIAVTASFGVASLDRSVDNLDALLQRADTALYGAKKEGRNRVVEWQPTEAPPQNLRRRVFKAGRITFNLGHASIDCTVRSLSNTGAGLDVFSSAGVPDRFKLQIESDGLYQGCRVTSKRDKHLEVEFE